MTVSHRTAGLMLGLLLMGCATKTPEDPWLLVLPAAEATGSVVRVAGVVEHSELEGGFYLLRGQDGKAYDPMNLPDEFHKAGLPFEADVVVKPDQMSVRQVGTIVQVVRIRKRADGSPRPPDKVY